MSQNKWRETECVWVCLGKKVHEQIPRGLFWGKTDGQTTGRINEGKKEMFMDKHLRNKTSFVRTVFSRNISRIFRKPFCHAFLTISEKSTKIFANVFVALSRKVPHSCYSWAYAQPCLLIHMEYWEHSMWISQVFFFTCIQNCSLFLKTKNPNKLKKYSIAFAHFN